MIEQRSQRVAHLLRHRSRTHGMAIDEHVDEMSVRARFVLAYPE
jgi:hypothetical protein